MHWKYSSMGMRSIAQGLASLPGGSEVLARLSPETRGILAQPQLVSWHDGSAIQEVSLAVQELLGDEAVEQLYYEAIRSSLGPVMEPLLKVMLMLGGRRPETLLSRMNGALASIMKGVTTSWEPLGHRAGTLTVIYEDEVKPVTFSAWAGSLAYTFDLVGVKGRVSPRRPSPDGKRFPFALEWD